MRKAMLVGATVAAVAVAAACSERTVSYKSEVQPILAANCYECHAPGKKGFEVTGFDTTSYEALLRGGKFGALIRPGDAFTSTFNMVVEGRVHSSIQMPQGRQKLSEGDVETLKTWVRQGAKNN
jgi:hypothetical protein